MPSAPRTPKFRIKKNDTVMIVAGRDRGKTGKVMRVLPARSRVVVERLNLVKRHTKARGAQTPGGIIEKEAPLHISNVMIFCDRCNAPVRTSVKINADKTKSRVCRRCHEAIGAAK
jgi:large subunit ribosomal protein L24